MGLIFYRVVARRGVQGIYISCWFVISACFWIAVTVIMGYQTFFVSGIGSSTLPLRVYSMIRLGVSPMVNALGTLIVVVPLIVVVIGTYFDRRSVS